MNAGLEHCLVVSALLLAVGVAVAQDDSLRRSYQVPDGLAESACASVSVSPQGQILVTHPNSNSVSIFDGYTAKIIPLPGAVRGRVEQSAGGQLWAADADGLLEFRNDEWISHRIAGDISALFPTRQNHVLVLLRDRLMEFDTENPDRPRTEILREAAQSRLGNFSSLMVSRDGGLWISAERGLAHATGPARSLNTNSAWSEFILPAELGLKNLRAPVEDDDGGITALADSAEGRTNVVLHWNNQTWSVVFAREEKILRAWRALDNSHWFAASDALFRISEDGGGVLQIEGSVAREILDVVVEPSGVCWLATSRGLIRHAPKLWQSPVAADADNNPAPATNQTQLPAPLPDAAWRAGETARFIARNGDVWFSSALGVARFHDQAWQLFPRSDKNIPATVVAFAELTDGKIIAATQDKLWQFDGRDWSQMRAGFADIHALLRTRDGALWVATVNGVYRLVAGAWIQNGIEDGLPDADVRSLSEDSRGRVWAVTARGSALFHPDADVDAPRTFVDGLADLRRRVPEGETVSLTFSATDRWRFTTRTRLLFSHRLDEREWSPFSELDNVTFNDLSPGKHYFQARAMDRNGNIDPDPARLEFIVTVPWFKEARLIMIAFTGMVVALFFAAVAFNRHRRLQYSYAEVERKIAERTRELELANRELVHSQKMNALGTLSAGIAHDFNNILSIVKGSSQIIEDNLDNPEKIRTRLDRIKTVVQQGAGIVEAMLGFSRNSDQQTEPCDVNAVVDDTMKLLGDRFLREVEVRFERGEGLPEISVARDFVQQVLLNFIFNAAEAMERRAPTRLEGAVGNNERAEAVLGAPTQRERKQITLTTRATDKLPPELFLTPAAASGFILISVRDNGSGIAPENLPRIFEPFFTTKAMSARRGTGLGLSMVYELAKKLEAGLAVETTLSAGSTFTILLPVRLVTSSPAKI